MQKFKLPFDGTEVVHLGFQNDNCHEIVQFDASIWSEADEITALYMRPDGVAYPIMLTPLENYVYEWRPCAADLAASGWAEIQLRAKHGETVWHTAIIKGVCKCSVECGNDPAPEVTQWVDAVLEAARTILETKNVRPIDKTAAMTQPVGMDENGRLYTAPTGGGGAGYIIGHGLKETQTEYGLELAVNAAQEVEQDNTLPITSAAVYTTVGNINALLETI